MCHARHGSATHRPHQRLFGQCWRCAFAGLQVVVACKIEAKVPGHDIVLAQITMDDDALGIADAGRYAPGRIAQMAARLRAAGPELAHHTCQPLGPVTGAKCPALTRQAQDINFFGEGGSHVLGKGRCEGDMRQFCMLPIAGSVAPHAAVYLLPMWIKLHNVNNCRPSPPNGADSKIRVQGPNLRWADCFVAPRIFLFSGVIL